MPDSADRTYEHEIVVRRRNPWVVALATAPFLVACALGLASWVDSSAFAAMIPHACVLGLVTVLAALRHNPWPREGVERVAVADGMLHVGAEAIPLGQIANAVIVPSPPFPKVLIERRGPNLGPIEIVVRSVQEGRALLRAIGYDASQRVFRTTSVSWLRATWTRATMTILGAIGAAFFVMGAAGIVHVPPALAVLVAGLPLIALSFVPTKVSVGGDGVYLEWLRWKRFVPIRDIESARLVVERTRSNQRVVVKLSLSSAEDLDLPMGSSWDLSRAQALVERIDEVRALAAGPSARGHEASPVAVGAVLGRLARTADATLDWLRALRALGAGTVATHRVAPVAPETFLHIVEDASAKPADRAAAAVALASAGDEGMRTRIRVISETVVEPRLRVALERSLDEDDAALEEAIDALDGARAP